MRKVLNNIEEYIQHNAFENTRKKGEAIARTLDRFGTPSVDLENDVATFRIMGTYFYTVTIRGFMDHIKSDCTCPYDWGGICKHQVGALLYLKQFLANEGNFLATRPSFKPSAPVSRTVKKRKASEPYLLQNYNPLTYNWLNEQIDHYKMLHAHQFSMDNAILSGQQISFIASERSSYYRQRIEHYKVVFKETRDGLKTSCSCGQAVERLCPHQVAMLSSIMNNYGDDFFKVLTPEYTQQLQRQLSEKTGIPAERLEEYFELDITTQEYIPNEQAKGLTLFDGEEQVKRLISNMLKQEQLSLEAPLVENEKATHLAFVFSFSNPLELILSSITGVPDGQDSLKYIKEYKKNRPPLHMTSEDERVLGIIAEIDGYNDDYYGSNGQLKTESDFNTQKFYFKKLTALFGLLQDQQQVYYRWGTNLEKIKKSGIEHLQLSPEKATLYFELIEEELFFSLKAKLKIGERSVDLSAIEADRLGLIFPFFSVVLWKNTLYQHKDLRQAQTCFELIKNNPIFKVVKKDFDRFYQQILQPLSESYRIDNQGLSSVEYREQKLRPGEKQLYISELGNFVIFKPVIQYEDEQQVNPRVDNSVVSYKDQVITRYLRDEAYEQAYLDFLIRLHPEFERQNFGEFFFLPFTELKRNNWFFNIFEKITEAQINVFGINDLKTIQYSPFKAQINTHIKSGEDWFDVHIELSFGEENVKLSDLRKAILKRERFVSLSNGKLGVLPEEWYDKLQKFFRVGEVEKEELKISKLKFSLVDELFDQIDDQQLLEELAEKKSKLLRFDRIEKRPIPENITAQLRDYQVSGYHWLQFLDEFGWGGILADDMGLGKTLQILTFLQDQCNRGKGTNLIVVPTTLLFNWENEIQKFTPELKYLIHHGSDRASHLSDYQNYDLIITTYGLMFNDITVLQKIRFNYVVLDESQAIKNPGSKRYKAACILRTRNRLAMTGTPIENNTFDLYAQINFLNPGFLGSQQFFKSEFSKPIDAEGDADRASELQRLIKPFVLRRTKEQVATELPPKVEDYLYCEMEENQRKVYEGYRNKYRDYLMQKIEEDGLQRSKLFVLEGLLKLRQICDSPEILSDAEDFGKESIKVKELLSHITEKTGKHKIIVFSQFVRMLRVIERELNKRKISYEYLDGQSPAMSRQNSVVNFQENESCRVFLISLKAGGTGLNLTAADYVYIVDPWWNPAVENQAIDRTHRIGQDKHIIAYRMICKDTIEEKIMKLQAKKLRIAQDIIHTDEGFMKKLQREDILDLFS